MNKISNKIFYNYYKIIYLIYFLTVYFYIFIRPGVLSGIILAYLFVAIFPLKVSTIDYFVIIYITYSIFTIIFSYFNSVPLISSIQEFSNSILPIIFYFYAKKSKNNKNIFFLKLANATLVTFMLGLYWYIEFPEYYVKYLRYVNFNIEFHKETFRIASYLGSTILGLLSSIVVLISGIEYVKFKMRKHLIIYNISILISLLTMQRSSYINTFLVILYINIIVFKKKKYIEFKIIEICKYIIIIFVIIMNNNEYKLIDSILSRVLKFNSAFVERVGQWKGINDIGMQIIFGRGLGSLSHKAYGITQITISDGGYFKILGELGIIGLFLFLTILILAFINVVRKYKKENMLVEKFIIIIFLIHSIGSNGLFFQVTAPIFWYSIGRICR